MPFRKGDFQIYQTVREDLLLMLKTKSFLKGLEANYDFDKYDEFITKHKRDK